MSVADTTRHHSVLANASMPVLFVCGGEDTAILCDRCGHARVLASELTPGVGGQHITQDHPCTVGPTRCAPKSSVPADTSTSTCLPAVRLSGCTPTSEPGYIVCVCVCVCVCVYVRR